MRLLWLIRCAWWEEDIPWHIALSVSDIINNAMDNLYGARTEISSKETQNSTFRTAVTGRLRVCCSRPSLVYKPKPASLTCWIDNKSSTLLTNKMPWINSHGKANIYVDIWHLVATFPIVHIAILLCWFRCHGFSIYKSMLRLSWLQNYDCFFYCYLVMCNYWVIMNMKTYPS